MATADIDYFESYPGSTISIMEQFEDFWTLYCTLLQKSSKFIIHRNLQLLTELFSADTNEMLVNVETPGMTMSAIKFHQSMFRDSAASLQYFPPQLLVCYL